MTASWLPLLTKLICCSSLVQAMVIPKVLLAFVYLHLCCQLLVIYIYRISSSELILVMFASRVSSILYLKLVHSFTPFFVELHYHYDCIFHRLSPGKSLCCYILQLPKETCWMNPTLYTYVEIFLRDKIHLRFLFVFLTPAKNYSPST